MARKLEVTIVPRQIGDLVDQLIHDIIWEFKKEPMDTEDTVLTESIPNHYYESYDLYQGRVYQQFTGNMCGYHAIYNTLCALNMFSNSGGQYDIQSRSSFWKFKRRVEAFLFQIKKKHKYSEDWPWRTKDILDGDFQRTYNKLCVQYLDQFAIFREHPDFDLLSDTWEFQYKNHLGSYDAKKELQQKFDYFRTYNGKRPLILSLMLAITTHWTSFLAIKDKGQTQYWYFDSFNNITLDYTMDQIVQFIQKKNQERIRDARPQMTTFQKDCYTQCQVDLQLSLRLIVQCIKGTNTIEAYSYNQMFDVFGDHLEQAITLGPHRVQAILRDYKHNIRSFFNYKVQWELLTENNSRRMTFLFQQGATIRNMHNEGKIFYNFLHKYKY